MDSGPVLLGGIGGTNARFALARLPARQHSGFRQRFESKGRNAPAMAHVPSLAIVHSYPGLLGAAALAAPPAAIGEG